MKKITIFIIAGLLSMIGLYASNIEVSGTISTNTTWTGVDTVKVTGNIYINDGISLTIDPGIIVEFQGHYKLDVDGRLLAEGTATDSITFTTNDTTGFHNFTHTGWNGIIFNTTPATNDSSIFSYCRIQYSKSADCGALFIKDFNKIRISNCLITKTHMTATYQQHISGAIVCHGGDILLRKSKIIHNTSQWGEYGTFGGHAMVIIDCSPIVDSCDLKYNYTWNNHDPSGAQLYIKKVDSITKPFISSCRISTGDNSGTGIVSENAAPQLINNIITDNITFGISLNNTTSGTSIIGNLIANNNRGIYLNATGEIVFTNNTIVASLVYGLEINAGSNLKIYNSIIYNNTGSQLVLNGGCNTDFYYCNIQDGLAGFTGGCSGGNYTGTYAGNFSLDPKFIGSGDHPYNLLASSPCINTGTYDTASLNLPEFDLTGSPRIYNYCSQIVDIGAYEYQGSKDSPFYYWIYDTIDSDLTWECVDTIKMQTDLRICDGATLTIDPGITVCYEDNYYLDVKGRLLASGIINEPIIFTASDTIGYYNRSHTGWGGIRFIDVPPTNDTSILHLCGLQYSKDTVGYGGAVYIDNSSKIKMDSTLITKNYSKYNGGGMFIRNFTGRMSLIFVENNYSAGSGGGIYCDSSKLLINNCFIDSNYVDNSSAQFAGGGGIYGYNTTLTITNTSISNNIIDTLSGQYSGGGGIYADSSNLDIQNSDISHNTIKGTYGLWSGGGGIYNRDSWMLADSNTIEHNSIDTTNYNDGHSFISNGGGGGLFLSNYSNKMSNNHINNNYSKSGGGGIYLLLGEVTSTAEQLILSNRINYNQGANAGGITIQDPTQTVNDTISIINNEINNNSGNIAGGILAWFGGNIWIKGNSIINNSANTAGAVYSESNGLLLHGNIILNNHASTCGGYFYNGDGNNPLCFVEDINNTIAYNTSGSGFNRAGAAIFEAYYLTIKNSLYWGNSSGNGTSFIDVFVWNSTPDIQYSNIEGGINGIDWLYGTSSAGYANNIETNPYFMGTGDHPYSLLGFSGNINAGTPDTTGLNLSVTDIAGNPRIYDGTTDRIDIGAYEFQGEPTPAGYQGSALEFDGADDFVSCGNDSSLTEFDQFTMEAWVKLEDASQDQKILGKFRDWANIYLMGVISGQHYSQIYANGEVINFSAGTIPSNQWTHLALTYAKGNAGNNGSCYAYVNGEQVFSKTDVSDNPISVNNADFPLIIGAAPWDTAQWLTEGMIDEVRIWNVARDITQIRENMYRTLGGHETGLVSYWMFYEGTDINARDLISQNNGTLHNMTNDDWVTSTAPLPFATTSDGNWESTDKWATGQGAPVHPWTRARIENNITINSTFDVIELIVSSAGTLTITTANTLRLSGTE